MGRRGGASVSGALFGAWLMAGTVSAQAREASVTLHATATIEPMYRVDIDETETGELVAKWESNDPDAIPPEITLEAGTPQEVLVRLDRRGEWTVLPVEGSGRDERLASRTER